MIKQLEFFSPVDIDSEAQKETIQMGDFLCQLIYLDRNVEVKDDGSFWGQQSTSYTVKGGFIWRLIAPSGEVASRLNDPDSREVAIADAKINARVYGKKLGLSWENADDHD